jgi:hypothetical protein
MSNSSIRLENQELIDLAAHLIEKLTGWDRKQLIKTMHEGAEKETFDTFDKWLSDLVKNTESFRNKIIATTTSKSESETIFDVINILAFLIRDFLDKLWEQIDQSKKK